MDVLQMILRDNEEILERHRRQNFWPLVSAILTLVLFAISVAAWLFGTP